MMGGSLAHEFMYLTEVGEDTLVLCDACGYAANRQVATFARTDPAAAAPLPAGTGRHPGMRDHRRSGRPSSAYPPSPTAKAVFMAAEREPRRTVTARRSSPSCAATWR